MSLKNVIILCKGSSVNRLTHDDINSFETIVWCNLHNDMICDNIPSRVDYLYLRRVEFINDLPHNNKKHLTDLKIKQIYAAKDKFDNVLTYKVSHEAINHHVFDFNPSTGLVGFSHVSSLNPQEITLIGLDNFENNKKLYYHNVEDTLSSNDNLVGMISLTKNNILNVKIPLHSRDKTIIKIDEIIKSHPNIKYTIISNDEKLNNKIKNNKNVILK